MNDGMYTNIRNYLEEIASQNRQIIAELKRINAGTVSVAARDSKLAAAEEGVKADAAKTPAADKASSVEKQLEAETGHNVVQTGKSPPTYVETDKDAPKTAKKGK